MAGCDCSVVHDVFVVYLHVDAVGVGCIWGFVVALNAFRMICTVGSDMAELLTCIVYIYCSLRIVTASLCEILGSFMESVAMAWVISFILDMTSRS